MQCLCGCSDYLSNNERVCRVKVSEQRLIADLTVKLRVVCLKFIKLVFPAIKGEKWDGNVFFDSNKLFTVAANNITIYQGWNYKIEEVDLSREYNGITYPTVLHVSHIDEETLISKRFSEEFYAEGVGLVERYMEIFDTQKGDTSKTWIETAEEGFQLNQTLLSFSKN